MATLKFSFNLPPIKAIKYLKAKQPELHFDYDEIMHEAHHKAFTVAKVTKLQLLNDIHKSLTDAQKRGLPFETWKKELIPTLKKHGWWGEVEVTNPKTGEIKEIFVGSRRLRTIFYTNIRVAYNVGRWQYQAQLKDEVYLRYVAILDNRVRPSHAKNHGVVRHRDDPFWKSHYPPNGWNCRCRVQAYSLKDLKRRGLDDGLNKPTFHIAHKDWNYDVRYNSNNQLQKYAKEILKAVPASIGEKTKEQLQNKDYYIRKQELENMVEEVIIKENKAYPINYIEIGIISKELAKKIKELLGKELEFFGIVLEKNRLLHASPKRKDSYKNKKALSVEELKELVDVLQEAKEVYIDLHPKHQNIIFVFEDKNNKDKINKIIININHKVKKFDKTNAVVTLDKGNKIELNKNIKNGTYIRVK